MSNQLSQALILRVPVPFGKYRGRTLAEIVRDDAQWVIWLAEEGSNSTWRRGASLALGLLDDEEDGTEPSDVLASVAMPRITFEFEQAVAIYIRDPRVGAAMQYATRVLRKLCEEYTNKPFPPEVPE